jgi:hypothetical protein
VGWGNDWRQLEDGRHWKAAGIGFVGFPVRFFLKKSKIKKPSGK